MNWNNDHLNLGVFRLGEFALLPPNNIFFISKKEKKNRLDNRHKTPTTCSWNVLQGSISFYFRVTRRNIPNWSRHNEGGQRKSGSIPFLVVAGNTGLGKSLTRNGGLDAESAMISTCFLIWYKFKIGKLTKTFRLFLKRIILFHYYNFNL